MPNVARSSRGCALCRKRKIKCDEGRPGCKKCAQIRKTCPGYPYQVHLQIRQPQDGASSSYGRNDQLSGTSGSSIQSISAGQHLSPLRTGIFKTEDDGGETTLQRIASTGRSISPPLRYDIRHQSLCFFLNLFCFQASRLYSFAVLDFLPDMIREAKEGSCIQKAATAVSRMTLADRYSGKDVRLQTGKEYGQALSLTNATIRDTKASIEDETVLAVWLLGLYEMISVVLTHGRNNADAQSLEEEWKAHLLHVRGAMNLLHLRGMSQFTTARGGKIFRIFKAAIQMRLFILTDVFSKDFDHMEIDVYQDDQEFVPSQTANKATRYFHHVARLMEQMKQFLAQPPDQREKQNTAADVFLKLGETLDGNMKDWSKDERGWDMEKVHAATSGTMWALYPSHALYHFYSFWVFLYWLRFLAARFKLYEGLIELLKLQDAPAPETSPSSPTDTNHRMSKYRAIIQTTATELIGLTAYALGDVTPTGDFNSSVSGLNPRRGFQEINVVAAMQLVLPLKMLQRSRYLTATQKGAVDLAISHIGDGFRRQPLVLI